MVDLAAFTSMGADGIDAAMLIGAVLLEAAILYVGYGAVDRGVRPACRRAVTRGVTAGAIGMSAGLLALFVAFGVLIGVLFGFFGMGGSFLVTPALLVMGYPSRVAVGSGLAFVFGTSVIATLKHRDLGQVDYKLGISMIIGTTVGLEVGKEIVLYLEELGLAGNIISVTYVLLLGGIGRSSPTRRFEAAMAARGSTTMPRTATSTPTTSPTSRRRFKRTACRR